ncbi:helix-turn-helix transcriptional regulator [Kitasatospora sp. NPDC096140]|uniref:helix-turn-helix transcriptional regulator n=1 Tax=Kitasatospora sp. NPDC096140 TaxID=3155425 RepID=UPI00331BBF8C
MSPKRQKFVQRREAVGHTQESLAEALHVDRTTVGRWETGRSTPQPWIRPKLAREMRISVDQLNSLLLVQPEAFEAVTFARSGRTAGLSREPDRCLNVADSAVVAAVKADAEESAVFLRCVSTSNVDDVLLEQVDADIARLAADYVSSPVAELVHEIGALRRAVFELLRGRQHPYQALHLYLQAGRLCGLATHAALDLGQYAAAATLSRTAWRCAESAGHNGLRAWIRSVQSLIAYWQQDYRTAVEAARSGLPFAEGGTIAARLLSLEARAAAALGDVDSASRAVEDAAAARSAVSVVDLPGVFTFPEAKQWAYAGTALLAMGGRVHLGRAVEASSTAIALYKAGPQNEQSSGDLMAACLDLANAHLAQGEFDGVKEKLTVVLDAAAERRTASISARLLALNARLAEPVYAGSPLILSLRENVTEACSRPALTSLSEPAT